MDGASSNPATVTRGDAWLDTIPPWAYGSRTGRGFRGCTVGWL